MTPESRLAIEIMHECGYTPHEIASDAGWWEPPLVGDVAAVLGLSESKIRAFGKRATNVFLEVNGQRRTLAQWSRRTGIKYFTLVARFNRGWAPEDIVGLPPMIK